MKILGFQSGHDVTYCILDNGVPKRDLAKAVSLITDIPTNEIYDKIKAS